jgi:hypothetical protein
VGGTEIYFVANKEARGVEAKAVFRVTGKIPELWDPLTGEQRILPEFAPRGDRTVVPLRFAPEQSFFIVFRDRPGPANAVGRNFPEWRVLTELGGPWQVAFDPKWGGPERITFATLEDWSRRPEPDLKHYSGTATYSRGFEIPDLKSPIYLDLGKVAVMAAVRLNGRELGTVWCAPWRVDLSPAVRAGANQLEITVANLWPNRLIGDAGLPEDRRRTWTSRNPFKPDATLLESGLLGPVRVVSPVP